MSNIQLDPQYGHKLTIGGKVISEEAIVIANGRFAKAYVYNAEKDENVVVGELVDVTMEALKGGAQGALLTGTDFATGEAETWKITPGKPCTKC